MNIDWRLLGPPVDVGARFQEGLQTGRARRIQSTQDSALAALASDPTNESALAGLTGVNPQLGMQMAEMARQRRLRAGLASAYDPATGRVDAPRVRAAYAGAGDVEGAMQFDAQQARIRSQLSEAQQEQFKIGARLLENVKDEASYQQARAAAQRMGLDLSGIPESFDPSYVEQVRRIGQALASPQTASAPNIQKEVDYYRNIGRPDLAEQLLERHAEGAPAVVRNPEDGTFTVVPPSVIRRATSGRSIVPAGTDEATLRAQAEEAIRNGADPAAVNARLQQMLGGAAPATGTGPFQP